MFEFVGEERLRPRRASARRMDQRKQGGDGRGRERQADRAGRGARNERQREREREQRLLERQKAAIEVPRASSQTSGMARSVRS